MNNQQFPTIGGEDQQKGVTNSTQQISLGGTQAGFCLAPSEFCFNPAGMIALDEFPDLDLAFGGQSKKKKGPTKEEIEAQKQAAMEALSTKGKPEQFFYHHGPNVQPVLEQM